MNMIAMWTPGPLEMGVVALLAILLFGNRLPKMISTMGKSIGEFKKGIKEKDETDESEEA